MSISPCMFTVPWCNIMKKLTVEILGICVFLKLLFWHYIHLLKTLDGFRSNWILYIEYCFVGTTPETLGRSLIIFCWIKIHYKCVKSKCDWLLWIQLQDTCFSHVAILFTYEKKEKEIFLEKKIWKDWVTLVFFLLNKWLAFEPGCPPL